MKDFLGNELNVGDEVLYLKGNYGSSGLNGHSFCLKTIERFTPKMIVFEDEKETHPHRVVLNQQKRIEQLEKIEDSQSRTIWFLECEIDNLEIVIEKLEEERLSDNLW